MSKFIKNVISRKFEYLKNIQVSIKTPSEKLGIENRSAA